MLVGFHLVSQPAGALEGYGWCLGPLCLVALVCAANAVWNIYFHQLSGFQGPKLLTMSNIGLSILQLRGTSHHTLKKAHERYGSIVRISPSTLSFIDPEAWNDIYGYRNGRAVLPKDPQFYNEMVLDKNTITMASDNDAVPIRKAMNTAFSHRALLQQEPMLKIHIRRLMDQLSKASNSDNSNGQMSVDLRKWMVFSVFDINSDFAFGEDMGCVASGSLHEWVQFVVDYFYAATLLHQCYKFPPLNRLLAFCIPRSIREQHRRHNQASLLRVRQRIEMEKRRSQDSRPDFMHHFLRSARKEELSMPTIEAQASVVILAGSETSSVALVGALFYTLTHLHVYRKLCEEIRTAFPKPEDITLQDVLGLTYLDAVIQESLRLHTPLANGFTRVVVDKEGTMICGRWVPRGTVVTINHYCCNTSAQNFRNALSFIPSRWLDDATYSSDKRSVVQPFSVGPRNCPGKQFALNNIKLILTNLVWRFDMELSKEAEGWADGQKIFNGWFQPALPVFLQERKAL